MDYCFTNGLKILKFLSLASETKFSISPYTVQSTLGKRHDKKIINNVLNSKVLWFFAVTIFNNLVCSALKFMDRNFIFKKKVQGFFYNILYSALARDKTYSKKDFYVRDTEKIQVQKL